jgi:hypothetical protein
MFKKNLAFLLVLFSAIFVFSSAALAQETEAATESSLTGIVLPEGAQRILPGSIPASISESFDKAMPTDGSVKKGDMELLVWAGAGSKTSKATTVVSQISGALKAAGWQYSVEKEQNGVTVFSALKNSEPRRVLIGYHGAVEQSFVFTWMELLPANGNATQNSTQDDSSPIIEPKQVQNSSGGSIVGTWSDGYVSMLNGYTPTYGPKSYTPGRSHVFKYTFHADGTFDFTGLMQFTEYGCSTSYFQDKRGRYSINGDRLTLTLTKNFWRQHNSCAASGNKEIYHKLDPETYTFSARRNKYGKDEVCLNSGEGDACYERGEK